MSSPLQLTDSNYLTILDSVDAVIYVADMDSYELLFLNRKARETSHAQLGSSCWQALQTGQDEPCSYCTNDQLLDEHGNPKQPYVWQVQNSINGEWWECRDQAIRWTDGRIVRLEIATNITSRKIEEQELRIKEERLDLALESAEVGIWDWNPQTSKANYNRSWAKIHGHDPDNVTLNINSWTKNIHPEDREQTLQCLNAHLTNKVPIYQAEFRTRTILGEWRWMLDLGKVVERNPQGQVTRVVGTQQDITARKRVEEELRASEENLQITLDSIGDAVISTDTEKNIVGMNPVAEQLTGWSRNEAQGKPLKEVFQIINAKSGLSAEDPVEKALKSGDIVSISNHTTLIGKDGRKSQIADSAAPIRDGKEIIIGAVLVFRDVTEEYYMREQSQRVQQLEQIGTLAGGIAHDFNNILSGIYGNLDLIEHKIEPDHPVIKHLQQAEISADRAKNLIGQLLTFAKGGEPVKGAVDIGHMIQDIAQFDLSGSKVKLVFSQAQDLFSIEVDSTQIQQAISNLVINAAQSMPDGGHLYIDLQNYEHERGEGSEIEPGRYIQIVICDEGKGIKQTLLPRIFDPYFSTKQTGRGLGLATVHSVIARHNGHIIVNSKEGIGTTFSLYLPTVDQPVVETVKASKNEKSLLPQRTLKIMIMDDEEVIRNLSSEMLKIMGHAPHSVAHGEAALGLYNKAQQNNDPFDLVILDLTIPGGMGGQETIQELLALNPEVRAIVSSGYTDDPILAYCYEHGFKGTATKPYTFAELRQSINHAMEWI
jgi:PAS domain S-box-containing protein